MSGRCRRLTAGHRRGRRLAGTVAARPNPVGGPSGAARRCRRWADSSPGTDLAGRLGTPVSLPPSAVACPMPKPITPLARASPAPLVSRMRRVGEVETGLDRGASGAGPARRSHRAPEGAGATCAGCSKPGVLCCLQASGRSWGLLRAGGVPSMGGSLRPAAGRPVGALSVLVAGDRSASASGSWSPRNRRKLHTITPERDGRRDDQRSPVPQPPISHQLSPRGHHPGVSGWSTSGRRTRRLRSRRGSWR